MIDALIRFSIAQRILVLLMVAILIGAGLYCLQRLPIDAVPDVTNVQVQVLTAALSLAPLEIERQITFPVEVAMSGLPGLKEIRSVSKFGLSAVTVVFDDSMDTYFARQLVLERLSGEREQIPDGIGAPEMGPISTGLGEIYQYQLKGAPGSGYDETSLRTIQLVKELTAQKSEISLVPHEVVFFTLSEKAHAKIFLYGTVKQSDIENLIKYLNIYKNNFPAE